MCGKASGICLGPFLTRVPDDSVIVTDRVATSIPGAGRYRFVATRDSSGSYAMIYAPIGRKFQVRMDKFAMRASVLPYRKQDDPRKEPCV
jgi:hypothetical protein